MAKVSLIGFGVGGAFLSLAYFDLPEAGLLLILTVDHILDMGRSATNVIGNTVASAVVAKWENQITEPEAEPARA